MRKLNPLILLLLGLALAMTALVLYLSTRSRPSESDLGELEPVPTRSIDSDTDRSSDKRIIATGAARPTAGSLGRLNLEKYQCSGDSASKAECESHPLRGGSDSEVLWLIRNGYPPLEEIEAVDTQAKNLSVLAREASSGDLRSMGLYGRALANSGQFDQAHEILATAVSHGSVFAVYELARVYGAKDYRLSDIRESAAHMRAAYLLGDSKAGQRFYASYPTFGPPEFAISDKRAYEIYRGILKLRKDAGKGSPTPRP